MENPGFKGQLTVTKVYNSGKEEVVLQDHNIVPDGMGYGLSRLFSNTGSPKLTDFRINYFQIGTSSVSHFGSPEFYSLNTPITTFGNHSNVGVKTHRQIIASDEFGSPVLAAQTDTVFGEINNSHISILGDTGVSIQIELDENTANGNEIGEIGLFMNNPDGKGENQSVLAAYRAFGPWTKTNEFKYIFNWVFEGVDCSECVGIPTHSNVYYGLSSVPEASRRETQYLDIYSPKDTTNSRAALLWFHPGALTGGNRNNFNALFAQKIVQRGIHFIPVSYAVATSGGVDGGGVPVDFPIFTSGQGFGQTADSSAANTPSSVTPFRLNHGLENAFSDGLRAVQFLRHNAGTYNIDPDLISVYGGAGGADVALWLAYAPDVCANTGTADAVEETSSRVFSMGITQGISDWMALVPYNLGIYNTEQRTVPTGKTVYDMSGAIWVPDGTGFEQTSAHYYASGDHYSPALINFPHHVKYGLGQIFGSSVSVYRQGPNLGVCSFHDWGNFAGLRADFEYMDAPNIAKRYWSSRYHCSALGTTIDGQTFGHPDNSAVYSWFGYTGQSSSSLGADNVPGWKLGFSLANLAVLTSSIPTGQASPKWIDVLGFDSTNALSSSLTVRQSLNQTNAASAVVIDAIEAQPTLSAILDTSGFEFGPASGDDFWYVSSILANHGFTSAIREPLINMEFSSTGGTLNTSDQGNMPLYSGTQHITNDPHDPMFGGDMIEILTSMGDPGVHTTSSVFFHERPDLYINAQNNFGQLTSNHISNSNNTFLNWLIEILSVQDSYYDQYIGSLE